MKNRLKSELMRLTAIDAVAGFEHDAVVYLKQELEKVCSRVEVDHMGNIYAYKDSPLPGPTAMIAAHSDEIGAIVTAVEKSGFLRFDKLGGILDSLMVGRKVKINGHLGVVGVKAGHLQSAKEQNQVKPHNELYIDVGAKNAEQVHRMGISPGSAVAYHSPLEFFADTDRYCGKAVDDRVGCAVLLELMRVAEPPCGTLAAVFTVQEEVGLRGATVAAYKVNPTFVIALDTMPCGDTPDVDFSRELPVGIGLGPAFQVASGGGGQGFLITPAMKRFLFDVARQQNVKFQVAAFPHGNTDAAAMHLVRSGLPTGVIALPRRYAHSPVEVGDLNDAVGAFSILKGVVERMSEEMNWSFVD